MSATIRKIENWFDEGMKENHKFMLIICDTFDYEDYPIFVDTDEDCWDIYKNPSDMQRVMEVYDLTKNKQEQILSRRAFNLP